MTQREESEERPELEEMYSVGVVGTNVLGETRFIALYILRIDGNGDLNLPAEVLEELSDDIIEVRKAKPKDFADTVLTQGVPEGIVIPEKYYWEE